MRKPLCAYAILVAMADTSCTWRKCEANTHFSVADLMLLFYFVRRRNPAAISCKTERRKRFMVGATCSKEQESFAPIDTVTAPGVGLPHPVDSSHGIVHGNSGSRHERGALLN